MRTTRPNQNFRRATEYLIFPSLQLESPGKRKTHSMVTKALEKTKKEYRKMMQALYRIYSVPHAAALWCGIEEEDIASTLANANPISNHGHGRGIFRHPDLNSLEPITRAITEAIDSGELPHGREDGKLIGKGEYVAYERRHIRGRDLKSWIEQTFPNEKPKFLFDDIERSSHTAISQAAYSTLKAECHSLNLRLVKATTEFKKLNRDKKSAEDELETLKKTLDLRTNKHPSNNKHSKLNESEYWLNFRETALRAVDEYPAWKDSQRLVQKTGNLMEWLTKTLGADNREAEVLKKILSDFFIELR